MWCRQVFVGDIFYKFITFGIEILSEAMTKRSLDLVKATDVAPVNLLVPISLRCVPSELNRCTPLLSATATFPDVSSIAILFG